MNTIQGTYNDCNGNKKKETNSSSTTVNVDMEIAHKDQQQLCLVGTASPVKTILEPESSGNFDLFVLRDQHKQFCLFVCLFVSI